MIRAILALMVWGGLAASAQAQVIGNTFVLDFTFTLNACPKAGGQCAAENRSFKGLFYVSNARRVFNYTDLGSGTGELYEIGRPKQVASGTVRIDLVGGTLALNFIEPMGSVVITITPMGQQCRLGSRLVMGPQFRALVSSANVALRQNGCSIVRGNPQAPR